MYNAEVQFIYVPLLRREVGKAGKTLYVYQS
jgi:hypothetical protein